MRKTTTRVDVDIPEPLDENAVAGKSETPAILS
jgi:hypothetical protein